MSDLLWRVSWRGTHYCTPFWPLLVSLAGWFVLWLAWLGAKLRLQAHSEDVLLLGKENAASWLRVGPLGLLMLLIACWFATSAPWGNLLSRCMRTVQIADVFASLLLLEVFVVFVGGVMACWFGGLIWVWDEAHAVRPQIAYCLLWCVGVGMLGVGGVHFAVLRMNHFAPVFGGRATDHIHLGKEFMFRPKLYTDRTVRLKGQAGRELQCRKPLRHVLIRPVRVKPVRIGPMNVGVTARMPFLHVHGRVAFRVGIEKGDERLPLGVGHRWVYSMTTFENPHILFFGLLGGYTKTPDKGSVFGPTARKNPFLFDVLRLTLARRVEKQGLSMFALHIQSSKKKHSILLYAYNRELWMVEPSTQVHQRVFLPRSDLLKLLYPHLHPRKREKAKAPLHKEDMAFQLVSGYCSKTQTPKPPYFALSGPTRCVPLRTKQNTRWKVMKHIFLNLLTAGTVNTLGGKSWHMNLLCSDKKGQSRHKCQQRIRSILARVKAARERLPK